MGIDISTLFGGSATSGAGIGALLGGGTAAATAGKQVEAKEVAIGAVGGAALGAIFGSPQAGSAIGSALGSLFGGKQPKDYQVNALPALSGEYYASQGSDVRKQLRHTWKPINNAPAAFAGLRIAKNSAENMQAVDWITDSTVAQVMDAYKQYQEGGNIPEGFQQAAQQAAQTQTGASVKGGMLAGILSPRNLLIGGAGVAGIVILILLLK